VVHILPDGSSLLNSTLLPDLSLSMIVNLPSAVRTLSLTSAVGKLRQARASASRLPQSSRAGTCPSQGVGRRFCGLRSQSQGGTTDGRGPGLLALKAKVMLRGLAVVNRRTKAARDVVKWRAELVADLGGEPGMTAARLTRIETLVRTKLLLEHLDAQLLEYDTLFSRKRGTLRPQVKAILTERNRMAEALERGLAALGASRSKGTVLPSLDDLVGGDP
jgi:hypothetical protein